MKEASKKPGRILIAELFAGGLCHAGVNSGLIRLSHRIAPERERLFYGERSHLKACRSRLEGISVRFRPFPFFPATNSKYTLPLRDGLGCLYLLGILCASRRGDTLLVTNLLPFTHWMLFLLNRLFRRTVFIVLHGQMEAFLPNNPLGGTKPYFRLIKPLLKRDARSHYVVLGEPIYREIASLFSVQRRPIIIDHPYDFEVDMAVNEENGFPLRLGQIGVGNRGKGTEHLFALAILLREEIEAGQVEIHLIGRLDPELFGETNPWVIYHRELLTDEAFAREIEKLHYALFLRPAHVGRAVPSGSFFDAVKYGKPFLALDHPFIAHYAARFPECGTICADVDAMAEAIRQRITNQEDTSARQTAFARARQGLSVEAIAESFLEQIKPPTNR
jgi:glycosyltransferase involved in cell wall biosynthesis